MRDGFFKAFFALRPREVRETVILSPIVYPSRLGKVKYIRTVLGYLVANLKELTFIKTPMTQAAVSDAVLLLSRTKCKQVVFVGAIGGLAKGLKIGDLFRTNKAKDIHSVNSIHEETRKKMLPLRKKGVVGIDLESRAFFSSARKAGLSARAVYVVTDLPLSAPFYVKRTKRQEQRIRSALDEIIRTCSKG